MNETKTYMSGFIIRTKEFSDGGMILKCSLKIDEVIGFLNTHAVNGWVNVDITKRREPGGPKKDVTHSVILNTYKPKDAPAQEQASAPAASGKPDQMPF